MPVAVAAPAQAAPAMAEAVGAGAGPSAGPGIDEDLQVGDAGSALDSGLGGQLTSLLTSCLKRARRCACLMPPGHLH